MQRGLTMREHFHWLSRPCTWSTRDLAAPEGSGNLVRRYQFLRLPLDGRVMSMPSPGSHDYPDTMRTSRVLWKNGPRRSQQSRRPP